MGPDNGRINDRIFIVGIISQDFEKIIPNTTFGPTAKNACGFFQAPKRSGTSRQGEPERNFQITASTNSRLPLSLLRPTQPGRPGSNNSIREN
jgi:hypothetical protein